MWEHDLNHYMRVLAGLGVNALRLPLAVDNVLLDPKPTTSAWRDAEAARSRSLAALRLAVRRAAASGILVLLDLHRLVGSVWPDAPATPRSHRVLHISFLGVHVRGCPRPLRACAAARGL